MMMSEGHESFKIDMQELPTRSSTEAQLVAGALAMRKVLLCQNMMTDLGFKEDFKFIPFHMDNTSALHAA